MCKKTHIGAAGKTYKTDGGWINLDGISTVAGSVDGYPVIAESDRFGAYTINNSN